MLAAVNLQLLIIIECKTTQTIPFLIATSRFLWKYAQYAQKWAREQIYWVKFIFIFSQLQNLVQDFDYVLHQLYLFQMTIKLDLTCKQ